MRAIILVGSVVVSCISTVLAQPPGGWRDAAVTDKGVIAAAEAAVKTQRAKEKGKLELASIVKAESQVVAGTNYKLKLQLNVDGGARDAEAVVWRKLDQTMELTSWKWLGDVRVEKK